MKKKKLLIDLREKTIAELEIMVSDLRKEISRESVQSYFSDQTSVNNVQSSRKKLAKILTVIQEKIREVNKKEVSK